MAIAAVCLVISAVYVQPRIVLEVLAQQNEAVLYFVQTDQKIVALTIDDSPHSTVTPAILDALKRHGARATFFIIGDHADRHRDIVKRIQLEGSELGNHLYREYPSIRLNSAQFYHELKRVDDLIGGVAPYASRYKWFRPGSGWFSDRMLDQAKQLGYRCALGSVYPFDTWVQNEWLIAKYISTQVFPGSIIILHDGKADRIRTARVLDNILPELRSRGYRVVSLSELVAHKKE